MTDKEFLLAGLGVYWGEGAKAARNSLAVVNSDPKVIYFMYLWFRKVFNVPANMFRPQIFINELHRPREKVILGFWSSLLHMDKGQFRKFVFIKSKNKKVYENHDSYYGVLALRIRKGTELKYRILGYLDALGIYR